MNARFRKFALLTMALCCVVPTAALAKGSPEAGKMKAEVCQTCHGIDGNSVDPNYPNLAGQHESYLIKALVDYRAGRRTNVVMASFAKELSNQDIEDLAAWYASQEGLIDLSIK